MPPDRGSAIPPPGRRCPSCDRPPRPRLPDPSASPVHLQRPVAPRLRDGRLSSEASRPARRGRRPPTRIRYRFGISSPGCGCWTRVWSRYRALGCSALRSMGVRTMRGALVAGSRARIGMDCEPRACVGVAPGFGQSGGEVVKLSGLAPYRLSLQVLRHRGNGPGTGTGREERRPHAPRRDVDPRRDLEPLQAKRRARCRARLGARVAEFLK